MPDGKRKSIYAKTQGEARQLLTQATYERDHGMPDIGNQRVTLDAYLDGWLARKRSSLAPTTFTRYSELLGHVTRAYGRKRLADLSPVMLASLYAQLQEAAPKGPGLSSSTVRRIHAALHAALREAAQLGVVASNVTDRVPAPRNAHYEAQPLTQQEARRLLRAARGERLEALFVLALATGARLGELLGLTWRTVDLDAGIIAIVANMRARPRVPGAVDAITGATGAPMSASPTPEHPEAPDARQGKRSASGARDERWEFGATKTSGSRRRVNLPPVAVDALRAHRARQLAERLAAGPLWVDRDLVFCDAAGGFLDKSGISRYHLHPLLKRAGVRRVRFHDFRHTAATLLLESGVNLKAVAGQLGHASVGTTGNIYGHTTVTMRAEVANMLDAILSGGADGEGDEHGEID